MSRKPQPYIVRPILEAVWPVINVERSGESPIVTLPLPNWKPTRSRVLPQRLQLADQIARLLNGALL